MTKTELEKVQSLVKFSNAKILVVNMLGVEKFYHVIAFSQKAIHQPYNEVIKGKCIDNIIKDYGIPVIDEKNFDSLIYPLPEESFKFGHDDYVFFYEIV